MGWVAVPMVAEQMAPRMGRVAVPTEAVERTALRTVRAEVRPAAVRRVAFRTGSAAPTGEWETVVSRTSTAFRARVRCPHRRRPRHPRHRCRPCRAGRAERRNRGACVRRRHRPDRLRAGALLRHRASRRGSPALPCRWVPMTRPRSSNLQHPWRAGRLPSVLRESVACSHLLVE